MLAPSLPQSRYRRAVFWREQAVKAGSQTLSGRLYAPASVPDDAGLVLHLHGGTFDSGSLASGEAVATTLAEAGAIVISLPYPLAPEARFPQALEIAYAALETIARDKARWVGKRAPLYVAGEEAGGNLAAALAIMARDRHGRRSPARSCSRRCSMPASAPIPSAMPRPGRSVAAGPMAGTPISARPKRPRIPMRHRPTPRACPVCRRR